MLSQERSQSLLQTHYRKSGLSLSDLDKLARNPEFVRRDVLDDLQRSLEQVQARATALQTKNAELEAYAHMLAHDLKDPLTVLIVTSDLVADTPDLTGQEMKEYLQQIKSTSYDMSRIINNLLLFAEVTKAEAPVGPVDMAAVVLKVRSRLSHLIEEHQANLVLPKVWPEATGYGPWIEEVWANYISNAITHGGKPPYIVLGASTQPDGMLRFWIRDNGAGIPSETRDRLFKPFSQVKCVHTPGHGLGLSIVLHIIEKLGGTVGVESELGLGSLFFFTLPACPPSKGRNLLPSLANSPLETSYPTRQG